MEKFDRITWNPFRQFSVERLLRFLVALNRDVAIIIKPH